MNNKIIKFDKPCPDEIKEMAKRGNILRDSILDSLPKLPNPKEIAYNIAVGKGDIYTDGVKAIKEALIQVRDYTLEVASEEALIMEVDDKGNRNSCSVTHVDEGVDETTKIQYYDIVDKDSILKLKDDERLKI